MQYVVYGAGAIGGVLGARLALAGHDVALIARGAHGDAIRKQGLRLESPEGVQTLSLACAASPDELDIGEDDVVLLAMKSQDAAAAIDALAGVAPATTAVACVQNGVANERVALRAFANVYGVCVMCPAEHLEPGVVVAQSSPVVGLLDVGRYPSGGDDAAHSLADAFVSAGFKSEVRDDVMRWKYAKLLLNLGNVVQVLCAPGSGGGELVKTLRAEGEAVLRAAQIAFASADEDAARRGDLLQVREVAGRTRTGSSTLQSVVRGAGTIETDFLNGEIVLLGRLYGVPTPANAAVQELARRVVAGRLEPRSLGGDELLARVA